MPNCRQSRSQWPALSMQPWCMLRASSSQVTSCVSHPSHVLWVERCYIPLSEPPFHLVQFLLAGSRRAGFQCFLEAPAGILHNLVVVFGHHPHGLQPCTLRCQHSCQPESEKTFVVTPNKASLLCTVFSLLQGLLLEVLEVLLLLELRHERCSIGKDPFSLCHVKDALGSVGEAVCQKLLLVFSPSDRPRSISSPGTLQELDSLAKGFIS
mmetsp:Transcript_11371/g.27364  ORF Transcript_11371/g.27364 Transcript_11371/m.27364 type:complete len:210 (+) Transcript_11371:80-709(+)